MLMSLIEYLNIIWAVQAQWKQYPLTLGRTRGKEGMAAIPSSPLVRPRVKGYCFHWACTAQIIFKYFINRAAIGRGGPRFTRSDLITALLKFNCSLSTTVVAQCRLQSSPWWFTDCCRHHITSSTLNNLISIIAPSFCLCEIYDDVMVLI